MRHASCRREGRILIQVPALPERSQPVVGVEEALHIGRLPSKHLLQLLQKQIYPLSSDASASCILIQTAMQYILPTVQRHRSTHAYSWHRRMKVEIGWCLA